MPLLVVAVLVVAVHLVTALGAWTGVGLLADDHFMVGCAKLRHDGVLTLDHSFRPAPVGDAAVALYRPFLDVAFWLEQPCFGIDAFGYHVTNSLLHCGTALLWFVLVRRWCGSVLVAAATALLFVGWPGHSEATHWIAARTNVLSTFLLGLALLAHDSGLARRGAASWLLLAVGGLSAVLAIGTKESAVFVVPVAAALSWTQATGGLLPRLRRVMATTGPMVLGAGIWLCWRAHCLGTWGTGTAYGWKAHRIDATACRDWANVLLAPAHAAYTPGWAAMLLGTMHVALLVLALAALRLPAVRRAAAPTGVLLALGYLAGIGLERLDVGTLENVRYTYEPALGLCAWCALGLLSLPASARLPVLAVLLALHAFVLDANRQSWLRVAKVYERMRGEVLATARTTQAPLRVFDAPGIHDGAFGYMNAPSEFLFWQRTAPPGTELRGAVSSSLEWTTATQELAAAVAATQTQLPMASYTVRWTDGALVPFALDTRWPEQPWSGTTIGYARTARERPFVGTALPVHVVLQTQEDVTLRVRAEVGGRKHFGGAVAVAAGANTAVALSVTLDAGAVEGVPVAISLCVEQRDRAHVYPLGDVVPANR